MTSLAIHSSLIHDRMLTIGEPKTALVTLTNMTKMSVKGDKHKKSDLVGR